MVADGMGVTILSDMVYRPWSLEGQRIELRNVTADIPTMDVGVAWNRHPSAIAGHPRPCTNSSACPSAALEARPDQVRPVEASVIAMRIKSH